VPGSVFRFGAGDYWISNLPAETKIPTMVRLAKIRWRIEHDYRQLKPVSDLTISKVAAGPAGTTTPPWPPPPTSS